jgi:hypothetical protein
MTTLDRPATVPAEITAPADITAPTDLTAPAETTRGSRLLAGLSVLAPVLVGTGVLFHPDDTKGAEHTLEHLAGDERTMWTIVHLVEPFAWLLVATTLLLALPRLVADGGRAGASCRSGPCSPSSASRRSPSSSTATARRSCS